MQRKLDFNVFNELCLMIWSISLCVHIHTWLVVTMSCQCAKNILRERSQSLDQQANKHWANKKTQTKRNKNLCILHYTGPFVNDITLQVVLGL